MAQIQVFNKVGKIKEGDSGTNKIFTYRLWCGFSNLYLNKEIDKFLLDNVHIIIKDSENKEIFNEKGEAKYKLVNGLYKLFIGKRCLDDIFWNNFNKKIRFQLITSSENLKNSEYIEDKERIA